MIRLVKEQKMVNIDDVVMLIRSCRRRFFIATNSSEAALNFVHRRAKLLAMPVRCQVLQPRFSGCTTQAGDKLFSLQLSSDHFGICGFSGFAREGTM